eukprot:m.30432 g.30432  ORF g.30432 m.30432 type:complete len:56 (+) comp4708_c0_seq1:446-613(+)
MCPPQLIVWMGCHRRYWLSVGVQPSEPVAKLLGKAGILPPFPKRISTKSADDVAE